MIDPVAKWRGSHYCPACEPWLNREQIIPETDAGTGIGPKSGGIYKVTIVSEESLIAFREEGL